MLKEGDPFRAGVGPRRTASQGCFLAAHEPQPPTPPKSPPKGKGTWGSGGPGRGASGGHRAETGRPPLLHLHLLFLKTTHVPVPALRNEAQTV